MRKVAKKRAVKPRTTNAQSIRKKLADRERTIRELRLQVRRLIRDVESMASDRLTALRRRDKAIDQLQLAEARCTEACDEAIGWRARFDALVDRLHLTVDRRSVGSGPEEVTIPAQEVPVTSLAVVDIEEVRAEAPKAGDIVEGVVTTPADLGTPPADPDPTEAPATSDTPTPEAPSEVPNTPASEVHDIPEDRLPDGSERV